MFSAWMITPGANRPLHCPDDIWDAVQTEFEANGARAIQVWFNVDKATLQGGWFYRVHKVVKVMFDEHSGPHLLLAEDDTSQSF
jgi:hypothetical protein